MAQYLAVRPTGVEIDCDTDSIPGAELPEEEYDTMGGLVFGLFGKLPSPEAEVSYMHYTFTVEKMEGTRILELKVERQSEDTASPESGEPESLSGTGEGGRD